MATRMREKSAARKENADKRPRAVARHIRISTRKARTVVNLVRGKQVDEALTILAMTNKAASPIITKVLNSAIANAENNLNMDRDSLFVAEISADQGPKMKRFRAGSRGMAELYIHYTSHIKVVLDQIAE